MTAQAAPEAFEQEGLEEELQESFDEKRRKKSPKRAEVETANVASISDTGDLRAVDYLNLPAPEIVDPRSMSDEERRREQARLAQQGRQYREDISPEVDPKSGERRSFAERYKATTEMEERERGSSLERANLVAQLAGYDYEDDSGQIRRARGEDEERYKKHYFEAQEDAPWAREEDLQDAAILGVMEERARYAEEAAKSFDPEEIEATEDVGADLKVAELPTEEDLAKKAAGRVRERVGDGKKTPTPQEVAARNALLGPLGPIGTEQKAFQKFLDEKAPVEDRPSPELPEGWEYDEDSRVAARKHEDLVKATGGTFFRPAMDDLAKGDLSGFNQAFGLTPSRKLGWTTPDIMRGLAGGRDDRDAFIEKLGTTAPDLKRQVSKDLMDRLSEDTASLEGALAKELETVILGRRNAEYREIGRSVPDISEEELAKVREDAAKAAGMMVSLQQPSKRGPVGMFSALNSPDQHWWWDPNSASKEALEKLVGETSFTYPYGSPRPIEDSIRPSPDLERRLLENYYATETLSKLLGGLLDTEGRLSRDHVFREARILLDDKEAEAQESYVESQEDSSFEDLIKELERSSESTESVL